MYTFTFFLIMMPFFFYSMDLQQRMLFWVYFVGRSKKCYVWLFLHASMNNGHKAQERQCFDCIRIHICFQMTCSCPWIIAFSCNLNTSSPIQPFIFFKVRNKIKARTCFSYYFQFPVVLSLLIHRKNQLKLVPRNVVRGVCDTPLLLAELELSCALIGHSWNSPVITIK